ncbi:MAG: peptidylprolyl isomerase [Planctomycetota bacterium]|jgi:hypothetical protein
MPLIARFLGMAALAASASAALPAQDPPRPYGDFVDGVVATVNDASILRSQVRTLAAPRLRALRAEQRVRPQEALALERAVAEQEIARHQLALAAKSFATATLTPDRIEEYLRSNAERNRQQQIAELGSLTAFSEELKRVGRTWQTQQAERRIDQLHDLAEDLAIGRRLGGQSAAFLTPTMLRRAYEANRDNFVAPARAAIVQVRFRGPDAAAQAAAAAAAWQTEEVDARTLASRYPGALPVSVELDATTLAADLSPLQGFALAGPQGAVAAPLALPGGAYVVAKVSRFIAARNQQFSDPEVQLILRNQCTEDLINELRAEAQRTAAQRTEVWPRK